MVASFTLPYAAALGITTANQVTQAVELARKVRYDLALQYFEELEIDFFTMGTQLADRFYISAQDTAGTGSGTIGDPYRAGVNGANLTAGINLALTGITSAGRAIFIDDLIDTSLAPSVAAKITGINPAGPLHILRWPRTFSDPPRIPVIDAFRPLDEWITGVVVWTETGVGTGIWQTTLDAVSPLPAGARIGPAGQHVASINLLRWTQSLALVDGRVIGEHRAHLDAGTRVLSVCLSADQDGVAWVAGQTPASLDIRLSNTNDAFLQFAPAAGARIFISGMRISGYDIIEANPIGYNIFLDCQDNTIYGFFRVRTDFADKHVFGMAGGSGSIRECVLIQWECEFGPGYSGSSGLTQSVAYNAGGGQSEILIDPVFREPTAQNQYKSAEPTIIHGAGVITDCGSSIILNPVVLGGESCHSRILNSRNIDPALVYEVAVGAISKQYPDFRAATSSGGYVWGKQIAYADFDHLFNTRGSQTFSGLQWLAVLFASILRRSKLRIGGNFLSAGGEASNSSRYLHSRSGGATYADSAIKYNAEGSVIDLTPWNHTTGNAGAFSLSAGYLTDSIAGGVPDFVFNGCVFRRPTNLSWFWINTVSVNDVSVAAMFNLTDCVFLDTWPTNQIPSVGTTAMTSATWAATDPATLSENLGTAWLIDQKDLLASARRLLKVLVLDTLSFITFADDYALGNAGDCVIALAGVAAGSSPSSADLVAGIVGTSVNTDGEILSMPLVTLDAYAFIYHEASGLVREPIFLQEGTGGGGGPDRLLGSFRSNRRPWRKAV